MRLSSIFGEARKSGRLVLSFEVFPPKEGGALATLYGHLAEFGAMKPAFVSVTYGAGGSTRRYTLDIASHILKNYPFGAMAHLTTVGSTREEMMDILGQMKTEGIENIIALRGDPPQGVTDYQPVAGGFAYAGELVAFMREHFATDFDIAVAGYPEGHPESSDKEKDWQFLAEKVKAGADAVVTQLFFDNQDFYRFRDAVRKLGVETPISAGIMPVGNAKQIRRITQLCGARIPDALSEALEAAGDSAEEAGNDWAVKQILDLMAHGVEGIHLYTMNRPKQTLKVVSAAGLV